VASRRPDLPGADVLLRDEGEREASAIVTPSGRVPLAGIEDVRSRSGRCMNMRLADR
jgi:hypothetical protein